MAEIYDLQPDMYLSKKDVEEITEIFHTPLLDPTIGITLRLMTKSIDFINWQKNVSGMLRLIWIGQRNGISMPQLWMITVSIIILIWDMNLMPI